MNQQQQDPIHMDPDGQWYFYNETWDGRYGPYPTPDVAKEQLGKYVEWLNQSTPHGESVPDPAADKQPSEMDLAVAEYLRLRDFKSEVGERHKQELAEIEEQLAKGEAFLMIKLQEFGVDSFKTGGGTVYTTTQLRAGIPDKGALMDHIRQSGEVELLQSRISTTVLKTWMDGHNGACPPGVAASYERIVNVRRK